MVDQFAIQVLGDAAIWAVVEPPTLSLFPGAEQTVTVRFRPARASAVAAGQMPFGIRVVSHEDQGAVVEEGTLDIAAYRQTTAEPVPRNSRGSHSATHELAIDNNGNMPVAILGQRQRSRRGAELRIQAARPGGRAGAGRVRAGPRAESSLPAPGRLRG